MATATSEAGTGLLDAASAALERVRAQRPRVHCLTNPVAMNLSANLLLAGYDTTAKLMANSLEALEGHPDQRRLLVDEPALIPNAIEEVLRWAGVAQAVARVVKQDTEFAGTALTDGEVMYLLVVAAGRDPSRWSEPERFDVRREYKPKAKVSTVVSSRAAGAAWRRGSWLRGASRQA